MLIQNQTYSIGIYPALLNLLSRLTSLVKSARQPAVNRAIFQRPAHRSATDTNSNEASSALSRREFVPALKYRPVFDV